MIRVRALCVRGENARKVAKQVMVEARTNLVLTEVQDGKKREI